MPKTGSKKKNRSVLYAAIYGTIEWNVRFQLRMHLEKFWLNQIQNGPLSAIIYFHMSNILQTVLDVSPLL